jgi:acrylyl-CoA reductase (NADPH)
MTGSAFPALILENGGGGQRMRLGELGLDDLPELPVLVRIEASAVNYKDGLILSGLMPLVQTYPMVPGIDLAGVVEASNDPQWRAGDRVIVNGWGLGERHWGGFAGRFRGDGKWLVRCPDRFMAQHAMAIGTAGYTAMLCIMALARQGVRPGDGEVLVTGACGGVGSVAIPLLARRGYHVVAATGRSSEEPYLRNLGAARVIDRAELAQPGAPLQSERWAGAIDTAGSHTLANICAQLRYGGAVASTGIAQGTDFPATMFPFALRAITVCGIDSVQAPSELRREAWDLLAQEIDLASLAGVTTTIGLAQVADVAEAILRGEVRGRTVVRIEL